MIGVSQESYRKMLYDMKVKAIDELEKISKEGLGGVFITVDTDKMRRDLENERLSTPCDCMECYIRRAF